MKIKQLLESSMSIEEELRQEKYKDYSQGIERLLNEDWALFRGGDKRFYDPSRPAIQVPRKDRKPANASTLFYYYAFKNFEPWVSLPHRSVICSTSLEYASGYGDAYYIIPKNNSTLCMLPDEDLWQCFEGNNSYLGNDLQFHFLNNMSEILTSLIEDINKEHLKEDTFIEQIKQASDAIEKDNRLLDNSDIKLGTYNLYDSIVKYFDIPIDAYNPSDISFKSYSREVWFSDEYLTIPFEYINKPL